jgi:hypothetical protein
LIDAGGPLCHTNNVPKTQELCDICYDGVCAPSCSPCDAWMAGWCTCKGGIGKTVRKIFKKYENISNLEVFETIIIS